MNDTAPAKEAVRRMPTAVPAIRAADVNRRILKDNIGSSSWFLPCLRVCNADGMPARHLRNIEDFCKTMKRARQGASTFPTLPLGYTVTGKDGKALRSKQLAFLLASICMRLERRLVLTPYFPYADLRPVDGLCRGQHDDRR